MYHSYALNMCAIQRCPYEGLPTPCADPTLTINNLRLVTASLKDWYGLGFNRGSMDIPTVVCNEIRDSTAYQTEGEKKEALLLYYLHTMPMASWRSIAGALYYQKEVTALQAVKAFLKYTPAGQLRGHTSVP